MVAKPPLSCKDVCTRWAFAFSFVFLLASIVPILPWCMSSQQLAFHGRFPMPRYMSLTSMTDSYNAWKPFFYWKRELCLIMKMYVTPDLVGSVIGATGMAFAGSTGYSPAVAMGCAMWNICKDHVVVRCSAYTTLLYAGLGCTLFLLASAICSLIVPCMVGGDVAMKNTTKKKREKKEAAMFNTMMMTILAWGLTLLAICTFFISKKMAIEMLKTGALYPTPGAYVGTGIVSVALFFQTIGVCCGVCRLYGVGGGVGEPPPSDEEKDKDEKDKGKDK